jgi:hypothetical protein
VVPPRARLAFLCARRPRLHLRRPAERRRPRRHPVGRAHQQQRRRARLRQRPAIERRPGVRRHAGDVDGGPGQPARLHLLLGGQRRAAHEDRPRRQDAHGGLRLQLRRRAGDPRAGGLRRHHAALVDGIERQPLCRLLYIADLAKVVGEVSLATAGGASLPVRDQLIARRLRPGLRVLHRLLLLERRRHPDVQTPRPPAARRWATSAPPAATAATARR